MRPRIRRMARGGQPATFDGGQMAPYAVHLADRRARCEQGAVDRLLVLEGDPLRRHGKQRRAAARDEAEHEVVLGQSLHQLENALRRLAARRIGHGMGGLHHFEPLSGQAIAVAGDHERFERALPGVLERLGHGAACLARADDDGAALGLRRQVGGHADGGQGGVDACLEHGLEKRFGRHFF